MTEYRAEYRAGYWVDRGAEGRVEYRAERGIEGRVERPADSPDDGLFGGRIWLAGLMGSGKSSVGRLLSRRLGADYVDNDARIADLAGRSTVTLARAGGSLLHERESQYVRAISRSSDSFIAGIPASAADRPGDLDALRAGGLLVYLRCDSETLTSRVRQDAPRPWLDEDPGPLMERMYTRRDPVLLAAAALVVDATAPLAVTVGRIAAAAVACG